MPEPSIIEAIRTLKRIPRSGWLHAGVSLADVESVADHTFGVALLSMIMAQTLHDKGVKVDASKALKMAVLHDLSESLTFDISKRYLDFIGKEGKRIKRLLEQAANRKLLSDFAPSLKGEATELLREHERGKTVEARVVTAADRLDLLMQLNDYRLKGYRSAILDEMEEKVTAEIKSMKNSVFTSMLREIRK